MGLNPDDFAGKPVIGIANSWSDLNNCNANLRELAEAVKRGVLLEGGLPLEFPTISLGEEFVKPLAVKPSSAFLAEGSAIVVRRGTPLAETGSRPKEVR